MADFRLVVRFENPRYSVAYKVRADSPEDARSACGRVVGLYEERVRRLESLNIFMSRRMVDCRLASESENDVEFINDDGDLILPSGDVELLPAGPEAGEPVL